MKILVTGGAGFVGTNLIKELKSNHDITSIDNYSIGLEQNHLDGVKYLNLDVTNIDKIENNFDVIFHLAGLSRIQPSFKNFKETFRSNSTGTLNVLEFAKLNNSKLIYSGSSSKHHDPYQSPYATSKYIGEELLLSYKRIYNLDLHIARFYNVYGPYEIIEGQWAAVIGLWRGKIKKNEPLPIVGDGNQKRDFTHVSDIVDGLIKIMNYEKNDNFIWELGYGENFSLNEIFNLFNKKFKCEKIYISQQLGNYKETKRENNKALDLLGWQPKGSIVDYIMNF
jgi:UDP-glucose 4-epimerase